MIILCAWHQINFPGQSNFIREDKTPAAQYNQTEGSEAPLVSHSLCARCAEIALQEIAPAA